MATSKPRITITLEHGVYDVVNRLAAASGKSMSSVVTEFLDLAHPQMERAVRILEAAAKAPDEAKADVLSALKRAEAALLPALVKGLRQAELDLEEEHGLTLEELADMKEAAGVGGARARRRRPAPASPPVPVTRGVGTPSKAKKAQKKGSGRA